MDKQEFFKKIKYVSEHDRDVLFTDTTLVFDPAKSKLINMVCKNFCNSNKMTSIVVDEETMYRQIINSMDLNTMNGLKSVILVDKIFSTEKSSVDVIYDDWLLWANMANYEKVKLMFNPKLDIIKRYDVYLESTLELIFNSLMEIDFPEDEANFLLQKIRDGEILIDEDTSIRAMRQYVLDSYYDLIYEQ